MSSDSPVPTAPESALSIGPRLREAVAALRRGGADGPARVALAYGAGVAGVAGVTLAIGLAQGALHIGNVSLLYLLVVLWLAATFGRGPAVLASVLAVLAYDYFFISPLHRLAVDNPAEWLQLLALLATALVLGQMTATVQARAREARESQQRTETLYELSQLIASTTAYDTLLAALAGRVVDVFGPAGVAACSLIVADEQGLPAVRAAAVAVTARPAAAHAVRIEGRDQRAQAALVLERGTAAGGQIVAAGGGGGAPPDVCFFVPLRSRGRVVGALGIAGAGTLRGLLGAAPARQSGVARPAQAPGAATGQAAQFDAFCEQIALALDRAGLQEQAIHAEALRESDQLKDALLGSVTHDLRTPLASIKAAAESLLESEATWAEEADRRELLESIDASADRLNRLVGNLLDLSRLEAGVVPPEREWHLIGEVVATVLDRLELAGPLRGRKVIVEIPEDVPLVPMDHAQIEQVLTNVLENALKYSPVDTPVEVRARAISSAGVAPGELEVRVTDRGIGVPPHELRAIFGKFYRVQQPRAPWADGKRPTGTGLGLAISDTIIRAHGGRIWAENAPGGGTTVAFTLPIPPDAPRGGLPELPGAAEAPSPAEAPPPAVGQDTRGEVTS